MLVLDQPIIEFSKATIQDMLDQKGQKMQTDEEVRDDETDRDSEEIMIDVSMEPPDIDTTGYSWRKLKQSRRALALIQKSCKEQGQRN